MKDKPWNIEGTAKGSGGAAQSSGGEQGSEGVSLTKLEMIRTLNKKDPISDSEVRKALEWKPWKERRNEGRDKVLRQRPVPSDKGYEDHMKVQAEIMRRIQEVLIETEDTEF